MHVTVSIAMLPSEARASAIVQASWRSSGKFRYEPIADDDEHELKDMQEYWRVSDIRQTAVQLVVSTEPVLRGWHFVTSILVSLIEQRQAVEGM